MLKEIDIRRAVLSELGRKHDGDSDTLIIEELGLCQGESRIDIAVINGSIHGFEIKSDQDTLKRLPHQTEIYNRSLDSVTLVVGTRHLEQALDTIPKWWGVVVAKNKSNVVKLIKKRKSKTNPSPDPSAVAQFLWRDEVFEALKKFGLNRGLANKSRAILWQKLADNLQFDELMSLVSDIIRDRGNWRSGYKPA